MYEKLIIFPSSSQIEFLIRQFAFKGTIYILLQNIESTQVIPSNIHFYKKTDEKNIEILRKKHLSVLCCHEEAIYWLKLYDSPLWELQFSRKYLKLLEKQNFKNFLNSQYIPNASFVTELKDIKIYPVIAKPSIGFGSIGVYTVSNYIEAEKYINNFKEIISNSAISLYQKKYFSSSKNCCLFEEKIEGDFFRTPVIVKENRCQYIFPVLGITKFSKKSSEYHWEEFELNLTNKNICIDKMSKIISELIKSLSLADGVYVAEFIQKNNNQIYMLEFSPRQSSERINNIIRLATGVNIEFEVLNMFLYKSFSFSSLNQLYTIRMRIENDSKQFPLLPDVYRMIETENDMSLYDRHVQLKYYIKHQ